MRWNSLRNVGLSEYCAPSCARVSTEKSGLTFRSSTTAAASASDLARHTRRRGLSGRPRTTYRLPSGTYERGYRGLVELEHLWYVNIFADRHRLQLVREL